MPGIGWCSDETGGESRVESGQGECRLHRRSVTCQEKGGADLTGGQSRDGEKVASLGDVFIYWRAS